MLHLLPPLKVLRDRVGREAPELGHAAMLEVSPHIAAGDQVPPYLGPLMTAGNPVANPSSPALRRTPLMKMNTWRFTRTTLKS